MGQSEVSNTNKINKQSTRNSIPRGLEIILCKSYFVINFQEDQYKYDLISTKITLHPLDGILLICKGQDQHQLSTINTIGNNRRYMNSHILPPSIQLSSPIHVLHTKVFSNYINSCRMMRVSPNFSKINSLMSTPSAVTSGVGTRKLSDAVFT